MIPQKKSQKCVRREAGGGRCRCRSAEAGWFAEDPAARLRRLAEHAGRWRSETACEQRGQSSTNVHWKIKMKSRKQFLYLRLDWIGNVWGRYLLWTLGFRYYLSCYGHLLKCKP
jgi:hypothetical protein